MKRNNLFIYLIVLVLALTACTSADTSETDVPTVEASPIPEGETITLGAISNDPIEEIEEMQALADYLSSNLSEVGITTVDIKIVESLQEMVDAVASGEVDIFFESAYGATLVADAADAHLALRRWKSGVEEYHAVIFSSADSDITAVSEMPGNTIAFEASESTSSFVLPAIYLYNEGLNLVEVQSASSSISDDRLGYLFSDDDDNTIQWVISGRIALGAINHLAFEELSEADQSALRILAETEDIPRHVVVYGSDLSEEQQDMISTVLKSAHEDATGLEALMTFGRTSQFDDFPGGVESLTENMLSMIETLALLQGQ